jgi:glycerol-3-phosphate acyltransferase PlsY
VVFLATVWGTRYISVGSIVATTALPPIAFASGAPVPVVAGGILTAALILSRHRGNLSRVLAGTERRVGQRA